MRPSGEKLPIESNSVHAKAWGSVKQKQAFETKRRSVWMEQRTRDGRSKARVKVWPLEATVETGQVESWIEKWHDLLLE